MEFGFMEGTLDGWKKQGLNGNQEAILMFDKDLGRTRIGELGWCEPPFIPEYEDKVVRTEGEYDIVQDKAGRLVRFFKGRRNNFMPTYLKHAVENAHDWESDVKPRLNPDDPRRIEAYDREVARAKKEVGTSGRWLQQQVIGPYMYLRALLGPEGVMYAFYDMPDLVEQILRHWVRLSEMMIGRVQKELELDEVFFAEDICYKCGPLISPEMWRRFLKPRYEELINTLRSRQKRKLHIQIDTDGNVETVIPLYLDIGMDIMSPFEAAAGCDVVKVAKAYPELRIIGGIDKRTLAMGKEAIDKHLEYIIPFMRKRGGYITVCDHSVPNEVNLENYLYYRKKAVELGG
jgi:hypothetical protein